MSVTITTVRHSTESSRSEIVQSSARDLIYVYRIEYSSTTHQPVYTHHSNAPNSSTTPSPMFKKQKPTNRSKPVSTTTIHESHTHQATASNTQRFNVSCPPHSTRLTFRLASQLYKYQNPCDRICYGKMYCRRLSLRHSQVSRTLTCLVHIALDDETLEVSGSSSSSK